VFYAPVASVVVTAGTALDLVFNSVVTSVMYALSREHVCHRDNDAELWIPSRCLTMDAHPDSDISAFRRHTTIIMALWVQYKQGIF
jgi:hypothetical protein